MSLIRLAAIQMRTGRRVADNIDAMETLVRKAAAEGATYVLTPEMTNILERDRESFRAQVTGEGHDPTLARARVLARELDLTLHLGSLAIRLNEGKIANRSFVIAPTGEIKGRYDKIHMFDVDLANGESWRESATYTPGEQATLVNLGPVTAGLAICYDLRFPYLFRAYAKAGAGLLTLPAAFTRQTGAAHWHVLLRARAIENAAFVLAAAQGGLHEDGRETYGHSLLIDPWGEILAELPHDEPGVLVAELDPARVADARARIPVLVNEREFTPATSPAGLAAGSAA